MVRARWKIGYRIFDLSNRGWIMGVLNVTPDSFSDGGLFFQAEAALAHAREMIRYGADIIDVGGESTRPGAGTIDAEEEMRRVLPVIERIAAESEVLISIDTSKAQVAEAALESGAKIVNDVSGGRADRAMLPLLAARGAGFIIMHMQGTPRTMQRAPHYQDVTREVGDFFRQQYARAVACGLDPMTLAFDPGIGFGKTPAHNLSLLKNLSQLRVCEQPLVVGVSRKSFLARIEELSPVPAGRTAKRKEDFHPTGQAGAAVVSQCVPSKDLNRHAADRLLATVAFTSMLRISGADVLRVHDVRENREALRAADALRNAS
jgi:dihydropteroate synthase